MEHTMSQRVIVGIETKAEADWPKLKAALLHAGAESVSDPVSYQPDAVVVTLPPAQNAMVYMQKVQGLPGVRYVESDTMRGTC